MSAKPRHLEPSKLGTKAYWDDVYDRELRNHAANPEDIGTVWFDDADAEAKILAYLELRLRQQQHGNKSFESRNTVSVDGSSPSGIDSKVITLDKATTSFLDLGCGNGSLLLALRETHEEDDDDNDSDDDDRYINQNDGTNIAKTTGGWQGPMLGVDYSAKSVALAREVARQRAQKDTGLTTDATTTTHLLPTTESLGDDRTLWFEEWDVIHGAYTDNLFPPRSSTSARGWDVVLDKGTFDAISLSAEASSVDNNNTDSPPSDSPSNHTNSTQGTNSSALTGRVCEAYAARILPLVRPGGLFLITSCNWTEAELRAWFEGARHVDVNQGSASDTTSSRDADADADADAQRGSDVSTAWRFVVDGRVAYRAFQFGGVQGQAISTLCFRKERVEADV